VADNAQPKISLVVAVARNSVIGAGGDMAWRISDDLKWFKKVTMGKPVVMGRKTYASIGKALPGRDNIVITRAEDFSAENVFVVRSIEEALRLANERALASGADELCIIGGGEIYAQTMDLAGRIYLTKVDADVDGDTWFPEIDSRIWRANRESSCLKSERNEHACEFFILERIGR
jgi:dihydrofolate reductase